VDKVDVRLRRLDSGHGFLLERMNDPNRRADPNSVDNLECIATMPQRDLENPSLNALEWLRRVGLSPRAAIDRAGAASACTSAGNS